MCLECRHANPKTKEHTNVNEVKKHVADGLVSRPRHCFCRAFGSNSCPPTNHKMFEIVSKS